MINIDLLRKLARSNKWLALYARCKDIGTLKLFQNDVDYSRIQLAFLHWLETYYSLLTDIAYGEDYITERTIEDDIICDAYLYYKHTERRKEMRESKKNKPRDTDRDNKQTTGRIVFKERNK